MFNLADANIARTTPQCVATIFYHNLEHVGAQTENNGMIDCANPSSSKDIGNVKSSSLS